MPAIPDPTPLAVVGATLWDGTGAPAVPDSVLVVREGRVAAAGPRAAVTVPPGARTVDARGKWLIPGLIDLHVHLDEVISPCAFPLFGVTSVRDCGSRLVTMQRMRARAAKGEGMPRLFWLGRNIDEGKPSWSGAVAVAGPAQVPALIADMVRQGVDGVKLYVNARADVARAVIGEAHRRGLPVTGHLNDLRPSEAAALGIDGLEHASTLFTAELGKRPGPALGGRKRTHAAILGADLDSPAAHHLIDTLARRKVTLTATLASSTLPSAGERAADALYAGWAEVPAGWRTYWKDAYWSFMQPIGWTAADYRDAARAAVRLKEMVRRLDAAGVIVGAGTDSPAPWVLPGAGLIHELELLVEAGLSPRTALLGATSRAAATMRKTGQVGALTPGAHADFLLTDADPLADVRALRRPSAVYQSGRALDRAALRRAFETVPAPPPQKPAS